MKPNAMKAKLAAGEPALGVSLMIPSPQLVEMVAGLGFDWVLIDCEHGTMSLETVEVMAMAAEASGVTPIVRPASKRAEDILQVMDRGAMGVQVPHVTCGAEAQAAVAAVKYHPIGTRSMAAGTRASGYGFSGSPQDYIAAANRETLVCLQLEDKAAIDNADEILATPNVDVFFIGPSDLSQSMGHPGQPDAPPVAEAIETTLAKIVAAGLTPGMPAKTDNVQKVIANGARYIYTHVPSLLQASVTAFLKEAKGS